MKQSWNHRTPAQIEGRQAAPAEPPHASLRPEEASDLHVQERPKHVRNLSWAHKYYVRALELAALCILARGELKASIQSETTLRRWQQQDREHFGKLLAKLQDENRQLKATIHLLTKGS